MKSNMTNSTRLIVVLISTISSAACKPKSAPCMSMSPPSELVHRAAILRLDVYSGDVRCVGASIPLGAPPPTLSKVVAEGQPIQLDVPAGPHVLLLSAFADAAGTELIGSACTEANLQADVGACFNLTLTEAPGAIGGVGADLAAPVDFAVPSLPDMSVPADLLPPQQCNGNSDCAARDGGVADPVCDLTQHRCVECLGANDCPAGKHCVSHACVLGCDVQAGSFCPGTQQCCTNSCIDVSTSLSNCGGCGRACVGDNVSTPSCGGSGLCTPTCNPGWGDCKHPIAPAPDDGCETSLYDVNHCGACTNSACSLPNAVPDCPSGTCIIKSCADKSHFDCDGKPSTGCECAGADLKDGANGCCAGGCQTQHQNGLGQPFYDCIALAAFSAQLAKDAATVFTPGGNAITTFYNPINCAPGATCVFCKRGANGNNPVECACWEYQGPAIGYVSHVSAECQYPSTADSKYL
jgi:hypothetical protein